MRVRGVFFRGDVVSVKRGNFFGRVTIGHSFTIIIL